MAESGIDLIIKSYVLEKTRPDFLCDGYSVGVCILPNSLRGIDLADDPKFIPDGYMQQKIWEGLNILPYFVAPHYHSDPMKLEMTEKTVEYYIKQKCCLRS